MKTIKLYREDNGQYSTSEAKQDDVSGHYVQKSDYDELKRENEGLRLASDRLFGTIKKLLNIHGSFNDAIAQHLADIKADAVDRFIESVLKSGANYVKGQSYKPFVYLDDARKYAEKLRGEQ